MKKLFKVSAINTKGVVVYTGMLRPIKDDGGINWTQVTIVSIEFIGDYHD